jgi:transcriptional regulator with GAF, ATPase, and Fis domain
VDFRLICSTNTDLEQALRDGRVREDLYFRINTITLRVPPLLAADRRDIRSCAITSSTRSPERYQRSASDRASRVYLPHHHRWGRQRAGLGVIERAVLVGKGAGIDRRPSRVVQAGSGAGLATK